MAPGLFSLPLLPAIDAESAGSGTARGALAEHDEQFIAGPENALVTSLAEAAVASPLTYNPIVLCGPAGVGKTSLAHALAARRRLCLGLSNVVAVTATDAARALAHALETDAVADLRKRYHRCDMLLIDELHRLAGKLPAQQFLLAAVDTLLRRGVLLIVTLRHLPQATDCLLPALTSRLAGGLVVPLASPGALARRELVRQAAARVKLPLPDDVIARLVDSDASRPRLPTAGKLRNAVFQLAAASHSAAAVIEVADVARFLDEETPKTSAVCRKTVSAVGRHFDLSAGELRGKSRRQNVAEARAVAMYLARRLSGGSYAQIGKYFGGRDHTTVLHACRKMAAGATREQSIRSLVEELATQIAEEEGS